MSDETPEAARTDHGFAWVGQSWDSCQCCGRPAREHPGMDVLKPGANPFGADSGEVVSWEEAVRRMPLAGAYGLLEAVRGGTTPEASVAPETPEERDARFADSNDQVWGAGNWVKCLLPQCLDDAGKPAYHHKNYHRRPDREPQPSDGPDYRSDHEAWGTRQQSEVVPTVARLTAELAALREEVGAKETSVVRNLQQRLDGQTKALGDMHRAIAKRNAEVAALREERDQLRTIIKLATYGYTPRHAVRRAHRDTALDAHIPLPPSVTPGEPEQLWCHANRDGECDWSECPQETNNRANWQRICPMVTPGEET